VAVPGETKSPPVPHERESDVGEFVGVKLLSPKFPRVLLDGMRRSPPTEAPAGDGSVAVSTPTVARHSKAFTPRATPPLVRVVTFRRMESGEGQGCSRLVLEECKCVCEVECILTHLRRAWGCLSLEVGYRWTSGSGAHSRLNPGVDGRHDSCHRVSHGCLDRLVQH